MGGIVDSIGDFVGDITDPVTDALGFGETDAQQAAKDAASFNQNLATQSFIPLSEALAFSGADDVFRTGGLQLSGNTLSGIEPISRSIRASLDNFTNDAGRNRAVVRAIGDSLAGNENAFIRARVRPLKDTLARERAGLLSSQERRGIRGSSFGSADLTNQTITGERALGDARAQAMMESLTARMKNLAQDQNISKDIFNAQQAVETGEFARALEGLGLTIETRNALLTLASNLFRGAGGVAADFGGVGADIGGTAAELEQGQSEALLSTMKTIGSLFAGGGMGA